MADAPASEPINLNPRHIVGIVQRILTEVHAYCSQPAHLVDPNAVLMGLEEAAQFISKLPAPQMAANGSDKRTEARTN